MKKLNLPNALSIFRIFLTPFMIFSILYSYWYVAFALLIVAAVSDILDGHYAKKRYQITQFGAVLDPIADRIFFSGIIITLFFKFNLPYYYLFILTRDILTPLGAIFLQLIGRIKLKRIKIKSTWIGKTVTFFQVLTITTILGNIFINLETIYIALIIITSVFSIICVITYLWIVLQQQRK